jgi:hypothetical protein
MALNLFSQISWWRLYTQLFKKENGSPGIWPEEVSYPVPGAWGREQGPLLSWPEQRASPLQIGIAFN